MGYIGYLEDILENNSETNISLNSINTWELEKRRIQSIIGSSRKLNNNQVSDFFNYAYKLAKSRPKNVSRSTPINRLEEIRESLELRINLTYSINSSITPLLANTLEVYRGNLQETLEDIVKAIEQNGEKSSDCKLSKEDIQGFKQIFIKQLINLLLATINKYVNSNVSYNSNILQPVLSDIHSLIAWHYSNTLYGGFYKCSITDSMLEDFFVKEFNYKVRKCNRCNKTTIFEANCCLHCGDIFQEVK